IRRRFSELAPEPGQMDVDGAVGPSVWLVPHLGQELALRHHGTGARGQVVQEVELDACQVERATVQARLSPAWIDLEAADDEGRSTVIGARPPPHGSD